MCAVFIDRAVDDWVLAEAARTGMTKGDVFRRCVRKGGNLLRGQSELRFAQLDDSRTLVLRMVFLDARLAGQLRVQGNDFMRRFMRAGVSLVPAQGAA